MGGRRALAELLGGERALTPLPVSPRKRVIFYFRCEQSGAPPTPSPATPLWQAPLVVDPSGVYFRPCGSHRYPAVASCTLTTDSLQPTSYVLPCAARRTPSYAASRRTRRVTRR